MTVCHLPEPTAIALAHSQSVVGHINKKIVAEGGCLPFEQFMQEALYAPGLGYYSAGSVKLGEAGDFITAPEISPLFGQTIARAIASYWQANPSADFLELGPGSAKCALDIAQALIVLNVFPAHYYLLEVSADLKARQQALLAQYLPPVFFARCIWLDTLPESFDGIVFANEVLDALAVHVFRIEDSGIGELHVKTNNQACFVEPVSITVKRRIEALRQRYALPIGYQSELNLRAEGLVQSLAAMLRSGLLLFIDYGFSGTEFYHPDRSMGTLQCHYRHHSHADPFYYPGLQDITSHIDFTALATCGLSAGLTLALYCHQAEFLMASGILMKKNELTLMAQLKHSQALQKLLMPHEMGELFKVIAFSKACENPFSAIAATDRRYSL